MAEFKYLKISELTDNQSITDTSVFIVNIGGETYSTTYGNLKTKILASIDLGQIEEDVTILKQNVANLTLSLNETNETINKIMTAGFNLIGIN